MKAEQQLWFIRRKLKFTQAEMARKFGVTEGTYARQEKNEEAGNNLSTLWRLALERILQLEFNNGKPAKPEVEQLPIGYTCSVAEYNAMKGQRGHWDRVGSVLTKTAMEAKTSDTNDTADTSLPTLPAAAPIPYWDELTPEQRDAFMRGQNIAYRNRDETEE